MAENANTISRPLKGHRGVFKTAINVAVLFAVLFIVYVALKPLYSVSGVRNGVVAQAAGITATAVVLIAGVVLFVRKRLTVERAITLLFISALIVRITYMLVTPANVRQYDTYVPAGNGHEGYAFYLFDNRALPDNNGYQFYHPPLNAFIQALFMGVTGGVTKAIESVFGLNEFFATAFDAARPSFVTPERYYLYGTCQILSVVYSYLTMEVGYRILKTIGLKGKSLLLWFAFFAFFPRHIMFAATLNNDALAYLLSLSAVYFALKWWLGEKKLSTMISCGAAVALGVNAKLSAAVVCLPIGAVFVFEAIRSFLKKDDALPIKKTLLQYGIFAAVTVPVALSFIVYAKIRFDQPLGFVFDNLNPALGTTHHGLFERLFAAFDADEWFATFYLRTFTDESAGLYNNYNMFNFAVRSAIFGEFGFWQGEGFAFVALISLISLTFVFLAAFVAEIVRRVADDKKRGTFALQSEQKSFLFGAALFVAQVAAYVAFYIKMPFSCTMDFRYVMPLIICAPLLLSGAEGNEKSGFERVMGIVIDINIAVFIAASALFYLTCI